VRGTLLRLRYDQFMSFGWKVLIPVALAWVVVLSVFQYLGLAGVTRTQLVTGVAVAAVVVIALLWLWPDRKGAAAKEAAGSAPPGGGRRLAGEFDAFADGFPVPPLPGQALPPSPRARRHVMQASEAPGAAAAPTSAVDRSEETR
jgi:NADH-quinone oxidoreductase subunit H